VDPDAHRERRKRIVRQATTWTVIYAASAIVVAVASAALVAFLLTFAGMPFLSTWAAVATALIVVPLIGIAARELRAKWFGGGDSRRTDG